MKIKAVTTNYMGWVTGKGSELPESLSYQKKDERVTHPAFFWYNNSGH